MRSAAVSRRIVYHGDSGSVCGEERRDGDEDEDTLDEASSYAYEEACGVYEDYSGLYGLRTLSEVLEELQEEYPEATEEDAFEIYNEERESWLDYSAEEYTEEAFESYSEEFSDIIDETKD